MHLPRLTPDTTSCIHQSLNQRLQHRSILTTSYSIFPVCFNERPISLYLFKNKTMNTKAQLFRISHAASSPHGLVTALLIYFSISRNDFDHSVKQDTYQGSPMLFRKFLQASQSCRICHRTDLFCMYTFLSCM